MYKKILFVFLSVVVTVACSDNEISEPEAAIVLSKMSIALTADTTYVEIVIVKGSGQYTISSSDLTIAQFVLVDNKLFITGYNTGKATVTIVDNKGNDAKIDVDVKEFIARVYPVSSIVTVKKGDLKSIQIESEDDLFVVMDSSKVLQLAESVGKIIVSGKEIGTAVVYRLKEYWPTTTYNIQVIEHYPFYTSLSASTIRLGKDSEGEFYIFSGCGSYAISISDSNIITCETRPWPIAPSLSHSNPSIVHYKGLNVGTSSLTVTDTETGQTKIVSITVY